MSMMGFDSPVSYGDNGRKTDFIFHNANKTSINSIFIFSFQKVRSKEEWMEKGHQTDRAAWHVCVGVSVCKYKVDKVWVHLLPHCVGHCA